MGRTPLIPAPSCLICGRSELEGVAAELAPFLKARCAILEPPPIRRSYCPACDFSFYDHRLSAEEAGRLYQDYRGTEYRALRNRLEPGAASPLDAHEDRRSPGNLARIRYASGLMVKWELRPARVLDYGGEADGWLARALFPEAEVHTWDLSSEMPLPPKGAFDLVLCAHVLEHVSFPLSCLEEIRSFLAPGGRLYLEVPYDPAGPLVATLLEGHPLNRMHEHLSFFSVQALLRLVTAAGLRPTRCAAVRASPHVRSLMVLAEEGGRTSVFPEPDPAEDVCTPILSAAFQRLDAQARHWKAQGLRVGLYPAGHYGMELLASTCMGDVVSALGDGDVSLHGQVRMGRRIYGASELQELGLDILLVASPLHEEAIARALAFLERPRVVRASEL